VISGFCRSTSHIGKKNRKNGDLCQGEKQTKKEDSSLMSERRHDACIEHDLELGIILLDYFAVCY
jgi:hypothetical protein